jgi:hypothetical protein
VVPGPEDEALVRRTTALEGLPWQEATATAGELTGAQGPLPVDPSRWAETPALPPFPAHTYPPPL